MRPTLPLILVGGTPSSLYSLSEVQLRKFLFYLWQIVNTPMSDRIFPNHGSSTERVKVMRKIISDIYKKLNCSHLIHASEILARSNPDCLKYCADHVNRNVFIFNEITKKTLFRIPYSNLLYDSSYSSKVLLENNMVPNVISNTGTMLENNRSINRRTIIVEKKANPLRPENKNRVVNVPTSRKHNSEETNVTIFKRLNSEVEMVSPRKQRSTVPSILPILIFPISRYNENPHQVAEAQCNVNSQKRKSTFTSMPSKVPKILDPEIIVIHDDSDIDEDIDSGSGSDVEIIEDSDCEFVCEQPKNNNCFGVITKVWSGKDDFQVFPDLEDNSTIQKEPQSYVCINLDDGSVEETHIRPNRDSRNSILSPSKGNRKTLLNISHHTRTRTKAPISNVRRTDDKPEEIIILDDDPPQVEEEDVLQYLGLRGPRPEVCPPRLALLNKPIKKSECYKFSVNMIPYLVQTDLVDSSCMCPGPPGQDSPYVTSNKADERICEQKRPRYRKKFRIKEVGHARNYTFPTKTYRTVKPAPLPPKKARSKPGPSATSKTKKSLNLLNSKWKLKECSVILKRLNLSKSIVHISY